MYIDLNEDEPRREEKTQLLPFDQAPRNEEQYSNGSCAGVGGLDEWTDLYG